MITVLTHTQNKRPDLLERCKKSVHDALPPGGKHIIVECRNYSEWAERRVADAMSEELVAFVDDDDYISKDSLKLCLTALEGSDFGAAITNEVEVFDDRMVKSTGNRTYEISAFHPKIIHHLCVMRGRCIDEKSFNLDKKFTVGIDWFIKQSVVRRYGCIEVPIEGYFWTQHNTQMTNEYSSVYGQNIKAMSSAIQDTWELKFTGKLPVFGDLTGINK